MLALPLRDMKRSERTSLAIWLCLCILNSKIKMLDLPLRDLEPLRADVSRGQVLPSGFEELNACPAAERHGALQANVSPDLALHSSFEDHTAHPAAERKRESRLTNPENLMFLEKNA